MWHYIFKVLGWRGGKELPTNNIPLGKLSFSIEGEIKSFPDKQQLKEFITTRLASQEMLKGLFKLKQKGTN